MKSIIQIYKERNKIIEGLKNKVFKKDHVEQIYNERMEVCNQCTSLDVTGENCAVPGTNPCCSECGCSLSLKGRSLASECPLKKWLAVLTDVENLLVTKSIEKNDKTENDNN